MQTPKTVTVGDITRLTTLANQRYLFKFEKYRAQLACQHMTSPIAQKALELAVKKAKDAKETYIEFINQFNLSTQDCEIIYSVYKQFLITNKTHITDFLQNNPYSGIGNYRLSTPDENAIRNKFEYVSATLFTKFADVFKKMHDNPWGNAFITLTIVIPIFAAIILLPGFAAVTAALALGCTALIFPFFLLGIPITAAILLSPINYCMNAYDSLPLTVKKNNTQTLPYPANNDKGFFQQNLKKECAMPISDQVSTKSLG